MIKYLFYTCFYISRKEYKTHTKTRGVRDIGVNQSLNSIIKAKTNKSNPFCMILTIILDKITKKLDKIGLRMLQNLSLCYDYQQVWNFLKEIGKKIEEQVKSICQTHGSYSKYFAIIDNVNIHLTHHNTNLSTDVLNWTLGLLVEIYRDNPGLNDHIPLRPRDDLLNHDLRDIIPGLVAAKAVRAFGVECIANLLAKKVPSFISIDKLIEVTGNNISIE